MNNLAIVNHNGQKTIDSRDVAEMIDRPHNDLLKSIRQYCEYLTQGDFPLSNFFIESTYADPTGRTLPCYLLTRKGCDMVANKLTGEKGVLFTAAYINKFHEMEQRPTTMTQAQLIAGIARIHAQNMAQSWKNSCGFQRTSTNTRKAAGAYLTSIGGS